MSDISANLALPYLAPSQAQKHVTHNEALQILDAVVQLAVVARDQSDPPAQPDTGVRHIVPPAATGAWAGQEDSVALWTGNAWIFIMPQTGWRAWVAAENIELAWHDGEWQPLNDLDNLTEMGINAVADSINRLSVSAPATLLNHEGAGHQLKINKADASDTASLLFQTGFSGRAEMGLAGSDAWSIKVSEDGAGWIEALSFDPISGLAGGAAVQADRNDPTPDRLMKTGAFGLGSAFDETAPTLVNIDEPPSGLWRVSGSTLGTTPLGGSSGTCLAMNTQLGRSHELFFNSGSGEIFTRVRHDSTWEPWKLVATESETGSNANGKYWRLPGGVQMCIMSFSREADEAIGSIYRSEAGTIAYPASFANTDISFAISVSTTGAWFAPATVTDSLMNGRLYSPDNSLGLQTVTITAIGEY